MKCPFAFLRLPTNAPSYEPTSVPSKAPSQSPSNGPTSAPSPIPSHSPSNTPSYEPTRTPSHTPSHYPTYHPSLSPTGQPTDSPSYIPTSSDVGSVGNGGDSDTIAIYLDLSSFFLGLGLTACCAIVCCSAMGYYYKKHIAKVGISENNAIELGELHSAERNRRAKSASSEPKIDTQEADLNNSVEELFVDGNTDPKEGFEQTDEVLHEIGGAFSY